MASTLLSRVTGAWLSDESNVELAETNKGVCERNERKADVRFGSVAALAPGPLPARSRRPKDADWASCGFRRERTLDQVFRKG